MSSINQKDSTETKVPPLEIGVSGVSLPEESEILNKLIEDFQIAFGNKLKFRNANEDFLLSTPQGQLVSSIAAMISDRNRLLAYYVNQVDPNYAMGRMQDGIGRIYFLERKRATKTTVVARCSGVSGTIIPIGTKVKDIQGNVYQSISQSEVERTFVEQEVNVVNNKGEYVFDEHQKHVTQKENCAYITFECMDKGAITCPFGTLTERYQVIQGWERVVNVEDGIVGLEDETQAQFEQRRRQSVAKNSMNSVDSIAAALLALDVVEDAYVIENDSSEAKKVIETEENNLSLAPHSVYACVSLRSQASQNAQNKGISIDEEIAKAIWLKKTPGCALNGNVHVQITDDTKDVNGNLLYCHSIAPKYDIYFDYAKQVNIYIDVIMADSKPVVGDPKEIIKAKIYSIFTGQEGGKKPRIGSQVLASQFYCTIQSVGDWARVISVKVGSKPGDSQDKIQVDINQIPVLREENITVKFESEINGASNE